MNHYSTREQERDFRISLILITGYMFIQVLSNLTVLKTTPILQVLTVPVGSLLYPLSFTWIDLINDHLGKQRARQIVLAAIAANITMVFWFQLYIILPASDVWATDPFPQRAIEYVLGTIPRIFAASLFANFIVENTDILIFHHVRSKFPKYPRLLRSLASNTVSAPLDGVLFATCAFAGTLPTPELISIIISSAVYKLLIGYISMPLIYAVRARYEQPTSAQSHM